MKLTKWNAEDIAVDRHLARLKQMMEEMANQPLKDAGKREPGEKGKYEQTGRKA